MFPSWRNDDQAGSRAEMLPNVPGCGPTDRTATAESLALEVARNCVVGAGCVVKYLFDEVKAATDSLGPDNKLMCSHGPFTGTTIPRACRMAANAKSPLTGAAGMVLVGGFFPAELRVARRDVIVEGEADKPTCLWIKDTHVQSRDEKGQGRT